MCFIDFWVEVLFFFEIYKMLLSNLIRIILFIRWYIYRVDFTNVFILCFYE